PMTDYLITGGAGFIGSNIAEHLVRSGKTVRVLDNVSTGKRENLAGFKAQLINADFADFKMAKRAVAGVRYLIHFGAMPSVPRSVEEPALTHHVNITGTLNLLIAARDADVKRVVFSSSSSVYGDTPTLPKREDVPAAPRSPYAVHKITGEYY